MVKRKTRHWTKTDLQLVEHSTELTAQLNGLSCPQCGSRRLAKHGVEKGNQRYKCKRCGKYFRSTTGNTIHHLHLKPKVQAYVDCMNQGLSLRKTAEKLDISLQTAFRWRHRFLSAMNKQKQPQNRRCLLAAYVLPFLRKGKPKDENKHLPVTSVLQIGETGRVVINVVGKFGMSVRQIITQNQSHNTYIKSKSIPRYCRLNAIPDVSTTQMELSKKIVDEIDSWLGKFRGVSTRYLENYWRWFTLFHQLQQKISQPAQYLYKCL